MIFAECMWNFARLLLKLNEPDHMYIAKVVTNVNSAEIMAAVDSVMVIEECGGDICFDGDRVLRKSSGQVFRDEMETRNHVF